jgi:ribonucleoside-diphosphate reductase alpha chain
MPFQPTGYSNEIFKLRYALTENETWEQCCNRVASQMALAEKAEKQEIYRDKFYNLLSENLFVPGGRILRNSGRRTPNLLNCFVLGNELDSREGWGNVSKELIITTMASGGCGIDASDVRPKDALVGDGGGTCPGPLSLFDLLDGNAEPVRSGGDRRAALMFSLALNHPDILGFIDAKKTKGRFSHANVSVRSTNTTDFIRAVKTNSDWELNWKGKYKSSINAKQLWDKIVENAYNEAEPGFLNWELVENESNIYYIEKLVTTNPCGEVALSSYDCCCLGHLVLPSFAGPNGIDWSALGRTTATCVRFLDNVLSVNAYPLVEMRNKSHKLRRIGLGTTGLADCLGMLGLRYGSGEANKFVDKLFRFISKAAYEASIILAVEKGAFPACDPVKHIESGFIKRMTPKIKEQILEHGIRNCAILTQAPTGTVSILSDNCSSGIEPLFSPAYERAYWDKDVRKKELVFHPLFAKFVKEGRDVSHFVGAHDLSVRDHLEVQKIVQKHIDNAVSKTINMPHNFPIEEMNKLWLEYLPYLKGTTFYREGTRGFINAKGEKEAPPLTPIPLEEAKAKFKETSKLEAAETIDCPSGVCSI